MGVLPRGRSDGVDQGQVGKVTQVTMSHVPWSLFRSSGYFSDVCKREQRQTECLLLGNGPCFQDAGNITKASPGLKLHLNTCPPETGGSESRLQEAGDYRAS